MPRFLIVGPFSSFSVTAASLEACVETLRGEYTQWCSGQLSQGPLVQFLNDHGGRPATLTVYEVAGLQEINLNAWDATVDDAWRKESEARREASERAWYARLKAKFEGSDDD